MEALNKSITLSANYSDAYNNIGLTLQSKGKFDEAIDALHKSISLNGNYPDAYNNIGLTLTI